MKIAVLGPGALGCLFAAKLQQGGHEVTLIDHREDRAKRIAESGVTVEDEQGRYTTKPAVATSMPQRQKLIIVLCKAYRTAELNLPSGVPVLSLQNGLGNAEALCALAGSGNVLAGTTSEASTLLDDGVINHAAAGKTRFGAWTTCDPSNALEALTDAGFDVEVSDAPGQLIWEKVVISNGINPLTALLDVPNGKIVEMRESRQLIRDLVVEASKVAALEGYRFSYSLVERAEETCRETATNISSMLQDVRAGRRTEIEEICGEILRKGEQTLMPCPRTRVVYQLVKSLEQK